MTTDGGGVVQAVDTVAGAADRSPSRRGVSVKATVARTRWQRRKRAATRRTILDTALRLFEQEGYASVTTKRIAEESGTSAITLFRYFPSKEDLVLGLSTDGEPFVSVRRAVAERMPGESPTAFARHVIPDLLASVESSEQLDGLRVRLRVVRSDAALLAALYARMPRWSDMCVELWLGESSGRTSNTGADAVFAVRLEMTMVIGVVVETLLEWSRRCDGDDGSASSDGAVVTGIDALDSLADLADEAMRTVR
ncbi:TetR/AcrR family transcriptional regulator [Bifidobacterium aesculapii]|uniref:TetR/AcrR family transcriptional regulator n=1 Tax=Bifidobacterium aesculapii TaxID=1329411 RepID=UPI0006E2078F|nr:TetR/AcrR family transcriptional regulator [Bifidobacterium aesculapii]